MTLRRAIRRLRLKAGDILLVHRSIPYGFFRGVLASHPTSIIYFDNKNDFIKMPFEELERIYLEAKKQHG
jgi:hypothetical protein